MTHGPSRSKRRFHSARYFLQPSINGHQGFGSILQGRHCVSRLPGGKIFIQMRGPGFDHAMGGKFREIDPPRRLVFTSTAFEDEHGNAKMENLNTVTFEDTGGKTRVTVHVVVLQATLDMAPALGGMEEGWNGSLDRLHDYLAKL